MDPLSPHIFTSPENEKESQGVRGFLNKVQLRRSGKRTSRIAGTLVLVVFALSTGIFIKNFQENQAPERSKAQEIPAKQLRVLEVAYFPRGLGTVGSSATYPLCIDAPRDPNVFTLFHPDCLYAANEIDIESGSRYKGTASPLLDVVKVGLRIDVLSNSPTGEHVDGIPDTYENWYRSLVRIFQQNNLCQRIDQESIDQVWLYKDVGYDTGAFDQEFFTSWPVSSPELAEYPTLCPGSQRVFTVNAMDMNRHPELGAYDHFVEGILSVAQGTELFWQRFAGNAYGNTAFPNLPGLEGYKLCGNDHFPPNQTKAYDYTNTASVASNVCDDWHPDGTGTAALVSCANWGCNGRQYYIWWLQRMPGFNNPLTYNGAALPAWHLLFADTANAIRQFYQEGKWLSASALRRVGIEVPATDTTSVSADDGTLVTTFTGGEAAPTIDTVQPGTLSLLPGSLLAKSVLGTFQGQVLQATSSYGNIALVTAAYRRKTNPQAHITSMTYCGDPMTKITSAQAPDAFQATEMWYVKNPRVGTCQINAVFDKNPDERVLSSTILKNIDINNPVITYTSSYENNLTNANYVMQRSYTSFGTDMTYACTYSTFPEGNLNTVTNLDPKEEKWQYRGKNIMAGLGIAISRSNVSDQGSTLAWNRKYNLPYALSCAAFRLNPSSTYKGTKPEPTISNARPTYTMGINGKYYDNADFTNLKIDRTDPRVYFLLSYSVPPKQIDPSIAYDTWSAEWNGYLYAPYLGDYTFNLGARTGGKVWIDDQLILNNWNAAILSAKVVNWQPGSFHKIKAQYYNSNSYDQNMSITWAHDNLTGGGTSTGGTIPNYQIIPNDRYILALPTNVAVPTATPPTVVTPVPTPLPTPLLTPSPTPTKTPTPTPTAVPALGILGEYYDNQDFTNPRVSRYDSKVDFTWSGSPITNNILADTFSVRWKGYIKARVSGIYTFYVQSNDGIKLWFNNKLLIDDSAPHSSTREKYGIPTDENSQTLSLVAGKFYPIQIDYFDISGTAVARLLWKYPGQSKQVIPSTWFFH
jgi:hypothetical protein